MARVLQDSSEAPPAAPRTRKSRAKAAAAEVAAAPVVGEETAASSETSATTERGRRPMSDDHKMALAEGRDQGRAVRNYLEALEMHAPKRGRRRTQESVEKRLGVIEETWGNADPLTRLHLSQERIDLEAELQRGFGYVDLSELETDFVDAAGPYSQRKGITYAAWRLMGVRPEVLRRAGISRG